MLKHGRAGVPLEVMGLMLGDFVDEFTVRVIGELLLSGLGVFVWTEERMSEGGDADADAGFSSVFLCEDVFAMPQNGTVSYFRSKKQELLSDSSFLCHSQS